MQSVSLWQSTLPQLYKTGQTECSAWGIFYQCGRVLCLRIFYFCGRVLCMGGILLLWQSALSGGYLTSVAECSVCR